MHVARLRLALYMSSCRGPVALDVSTVARPASQDSHEASEECQLPRWTAYKEETVAGHRQRSCATREMFLDAT